MREAEGCLYSNHRHGHLRSSGRRCLFLKTRALGHTRLACHLSPSASSIAPQQFAPHAGNFCPRNLPESFGVFSQLFYDASLPRDDAWSGVVLIAFACFFLAIVVFHPALTLRRFRRVRCVFRTILLSSRLSHLTAHLMNISAALPHGVCCQAAFYDVSLHVSCFDGHAQSLAVSRGPRMSLENTTGYRSTMKVLLTFWACT